MIVDSSAEWASSSAGRARRSQRRGRGFESHLVHQFFHGSTFTTQTTPITCPVEYIWRLTQVRRPYIHSKAAIRFAPSESPRGLSCAPCLLFALLAKAAMADHTPTYSYFCT